MTTLIQTIDRIGPSVRPRLDPVTRRGTAVAGLVALVATVPGGWALALEALSEAYLAVAVFVAGTLLLVYAAERALGTDLGSWLTRYQRWQVPAGALLGAFPGCGGAIVAVTQFTRGALSFGGVVATLTATMGDAMFLLLAREPGTALGVLALGVVVGTITGYAIDAVHGTDYLRPRLTAPAPHTAADRPWLAARIHWADRAWLALAVPGVLVGVLAAFQVDLDVLVPAWVPFAPTFWLGVAGAALAVGMWVSRGGEASNRPCRDGSCALAGQAPAPRPIVSDLIDDTNFITGWVVFAFVGYQLMVAAWGLDMGEMLAVWAPLVPAMAILVGFIPGCGPQILVTSLYLAGSVPLSAQLGNAIANDGDALFPAIAVAPKAAMVASLYSAIPAVVVGYGWFLLIE